MQGYTLKTIISTSSPKTGDKTYEHVKQEIEAVESVKAPVIAVVSGAAGEAAKARRLLILWRPDILTLDCSHQLNLSMGGKPWFCHACIFLLCMYTLLNCTSHASTFVYAGYLNKKKTDHRYIDVVGNAIDSGIMVDQALCAIWHAAREAA